MTEELLPTEVDVAERGEHRVRHVNKSNILLVLIRQVADDLRLAGGNGVKANGNKSPLATPRDRRAEPLHAVPLPPKRRLDEYGDDSRLATHLLPLGSYCGNTDDQLSTDCDRLVNTRSE